VVEPSHAELLDQEPLRREDLRDRYEPVGHEDDDLVNGGERLEVLDKDGGRAVNTVGVVQAEPSRANDRGICLCNEKLFFCVQRRESRVSWHGTNGLAADEFVRRQGLWPPSPVRYI
jgi:hypothetical protein